MTCGTDNVEILDGWIVCCGKCKIMSDIVQILVL
jgi:hypothetical protein